MRCSALKSKLNRFLDGELSAEQRAYVDRHVRECPSCRAALERLRYAVGSLSQLPEPPEVPHGFSQRVLDRAGNRREYPVFWRPLTPTMRVAAAAMLALGLSMGVLAGKGNMRTAPTRYDRPHMGDIAPQRGAILPDVDIFNSFDYFANMPTGSLADAYVRLSSEEEGRVR